MEEQAVKPLTPIAITLATQLNRLQRSIGNQGESSDDCLDCSNTGWKVVPGEGAMLCGCAHGESVRSKSANARRILPVNVVPKLYQGLRIETMQPITARHPKQESLLAMLKEDPRASLILYGADSFGAGKSAIGWALYQSAIAVGREASAGRLASFVGMMRDWEIDGKEPVVKPADLRLWDGGLLFFDEFDKVKLSDFSVRQVFEFVNVAYEERQQVVVATNLSKEECETHWKECGGRYGPAIYRRLFDRDDVIAVNLDRVAGRD